VAVEDFSLKQFKKKGIYTMQNVHVRVEWFP